MQHSGKSFLKRAFARLSGGPQAEETSLKSLYRDDATGLAIELPSYGFPCPKLWRSLFQKNEKSSPQPGYESTEVGRGTLSGRFVAVRRRLIQQCQMAALLGGRSPAATRPDSSPWCRKLTQLGPRQFLPGLSLLRRRSTLLPGQPR